jgi:hypothetical protein
VATILSGSFEAGQRVTTSTAGFLAPETTIVSVSGGQATLSKAAEGTATRLVRVFTTQMSSVTGGPYHVGDELTGTGLAAGTKVTAVGAGTLTLSRATAASYESGQISFTILEPTTPLPFDATAEEVQDALDALPAFTPGDFEVSGGPGGDASHPYFIDFGGDLAEEDVEPFIAGSGELIGEHAFVHVFTTLPGGPGTGDVVILPANIGAKATHGVITVHLGPLPAGVVLAGEPSGNDWTCTGAAGESSATCITERAFLAVHSSAYPVDVPVEVRSASPFEATAPVEVSGGGVPQPATFQLPIVVSADPAPFGLAAVWAGSFEADGSPSVQAGGHPHSSAAYFMATTVRAASGEVTPAGDARDEVFDLPPGFVGNPLATKRCPQSTLVEPAGGSELCNSEMSVGTLVPFLSSLTQGLEFPEAPLLNDVPPRGYAAEFSTKLGYPLQSVLATVNSEEDFGIRLHAFNNANVLKIFGAFTAFEGVPAKGNGQALLTNPVNCAETAERTPVVVGRADTYQHVGQFSEPTVIAQPAVVGCDKLKFGGVTPQTPNGQVAFSFRPTDSQGGQVSRGSSPVGATAHLRIDQGGLTDPDGLVTPELKRSVIRLPEGLNLNPSSANGLEGCSEAQIGYRGGGFPMPNPMRFNEAQPTCPDGSKLGTAEVQTPLLESPLVGEVFLAHQEENPFGSLLAVYLVVNDPLTGVPIKLPGEVRPNPVTGQLTTVFDYNPQLPFEDLYLHLRGGGPRSEFATSEVCGSFPTEGTWTPWSAPESGPPAQTRDTVTISGDCASSPGARPFRPSFEAGTRSSLAGAYSPLVIKVDRKDGEQELRNLDFTLPAGVSGKLAGIPYCSDAQIAEAEGKTGRREKASSSCPAASELGTVDTAAGVGSEPFNVQGHVYLAGPYRGAPLSSVVVTPAVAGPFDLGDVVVRAPIYVNPETAQLTAKSDPIPTILKGIPLKVRSVTIDIDRSGFSLNPTNCEVMSATASIGSSDGATAKPSNRFQVGGCESLPFKPRLKLQVIGKTKRNAKPSLKAELTAKPGEANIARAQVNLPHSEFLEQNHIKTVCTRVQFAEGDGNGSACPAGSIYGKVKAWSPLLEAPLEGNVYLRSNGGERKLPDVVAALDGQVDIALWGKVDSGKNHGIRNTFEVVPDAPVSRFVLEMFGGKKGLLVNSENLCSKKAKRNAIVRLVGQNGKVENFKPKVQAQCKKHGKKNKKHHRKSGKK